MEMTTNGVHWQIAPECRERLLGPEGLPLERWLATGQASVVKSGPHRTVYRVALSGLAFYLKHYRLPTLRAWLRQLVRPAKARMEYERALAVAARGVPTVTPLALGEERSRRGPGESFLITRSLENTEPLTAFVLTTLPALEPAQQSRLRQRLATKLAKLIAQMHDAGIVHQDLYAGNILVRLDGDDEFELYLVDLHAVDLGRPLGWRASRENLIMFTRWFLTHASRTDRLRFWRAYCRSRGPESRLHGQARQTQPLLRQFLDERGCDLEERTWASLVRFWRHRDKRCRASNRYYRPIGSKLGLSGVAGYALGNVDATAMQSLLDDPDEPFRRHAATLLKDSPSSTVAEFDLVVDGQRRRVIYKRFRIKSWTTPWLSLLRPTKAIRSWVLGQGLHERELPTARPLAVFQRRRGLLDYEGYLLTEKIQDAVDLHDYLLHLQDRNASEARTILRRRIEQLARLIRLLHRHQLSHRDLKAANLLVTGHDCPASTGEPAYWFIDLVGLTRHRKIARKRLVQNLSRLNASFHADSSLTRADRLRFLRCYLQWGVAGREGWKRWWREIEQATLAKAARNERTGRPLA